MQPELINAYTRDIKIGGLATNFSLAAPLLFARQSIYSGLGSLFPACHLPNRKSENDSQLTSEYRNQNIPSPGLGLPDITSEYFTQTHNTDLPPGAHAPVVRILECGALIVARLRATPTDFANLSLLINNVHSEEICEIYSCANQGRIAHWF